MGSMKIGSQGLGCMLSGSSAALRLFNQAAASSGTSGVISSVSAGAGSQANGASTSAGAASSSVCSVSSSASSEPISSGSISHGMRTLPVNPSVCCRLSKKSGVCSVSGAGVVSIGTADLCVEPVSHSSEISGASGRMLSARCETPG